MLIGVNNERKFVILKTLNKFFENHMFWKEKQN
jgi:hypothetical protein